MTPGSRNKFGAPMFEPKAFRKQMYCIEESACDSWDFSALFMVIRHPAQWLGAPIVIQRPGNCAHLAPLVTPLKLSSKHMALALPRSNVKTRLIACESSGTFGKRACCKIYCIGSDRKRLGICNWAEDAKRLAPTPRAQVRDKCGFFKMLSGIAAYYYLQCQKRHRKKGLF